jgi:hypothetical protein
MRWPQQYLVAHGVSVANAPFGLYTVVARDGYVYGGRDRNRDQDVAVPAGTDETNRHCMCRLPSVA